MKITVTHKYLTFPINKLKASKKVMFFDKGDLVYELNCNLDMLEPNFTAYVDVERFMGKDIRMQKIKGC